MSNIYVTIKEWRKKGLRYFLNFLVRLKHELYSGIEKIISEFRELDSRHEYQHPKNLHINIKCCGSLSPAVQTIQGEWSHLPVPDREWLINDLKTEPLSEENIEVIKDLASEVFTRYSSFNITLRGIKVMYSVIWINIIDERQYLKQIHQNLKQNLRDFIYHYPYEAKDYTPHVTIAKLYYSDITELISKAKEFQG